MNFINIKDSNVIRYVNFHAVRFIWIEDFGEDFCEKNGFQDERFSVVAEHDIYLRSFPTREQAESYLDELVAKLNGEGKPRGK